MLVAGFSQFNQTCFSTKTLLFCSGCRNRESGGWGATGFCPCAAWGLVSLWAALDSSRLWRVLGRPLDPLGTQALFGMLLGALNMGASLLVVRSRTPR
jgi:hypothetical protein